MGNRMLKRARSDRENGGRTRLAGLLLLLLPGCMFIGLLAPAAVTVDVAEPERLEGPVFEAPLAVKARKLPLAAPSQFTSNVAPPRLVDLAWLLSEGRTRSGRTPLMVARAETAQDDVIVLAAEETNPPPGGKLPEQPAGTVFAMNSSLNVNTRAIWDPKFFNVIGGTVSTNGSTAFDDFVGQDARIIKGTPPAPAVPEPSTGLLVGAGLLLLARRSRRA